MGDGFADHFEGGCMLLTLIIKCQVSCYYRIFFRYFTTSLLPGSDMHAVILRYTCEPYRHFDKVLISSKNLHTKYDFVKNMFVTF